MNLFFKVFISFFLCFFALDVKAEELVSDFSGGNVVLDLESEEDWEEYNKSALTPEDRILGTMDYFKNLEALREEQKKSEEYYDEKLLNELSVLTPSNTEEAHYKKYKIYMYFMKVYDVALQLYNDAKESFLVPSEPPLVVEDAQYDIGYSNDYMEVPEDHVAVIKDFKKIVSYSNDPRDFAAIEEKMRRDREVKDNLSHKEHLAKAISDFDVLKFFSSDYEGEEGLGELGHSPWIEKEGIKGRIISEYTAIKDKNKLRAALNFYVDKEHFVLASSLSDNPYFNSDFSRSSNISSPQIFYPVPNKIIINGEDNYIYTGFFSIPFVADIVDSDEDVILDVDATLKLCNTSFVCEDITLSPYFRLEADYGFFSHYGNYVIQTLYGIPKHSNDKISISSVSEVEKEDGGRSLLLEFNNKYRISSFDIFLESESVKFGKPSYVVVGKNVNAIVDIIGNKSLVDAPVSVTVVVNKKHSIRQDVNVMEHVDDFSAVKVNLVKFLLVVLSGLVLNFMPLTLSLLLLKCLSINKTGGRRSKYIKGSFIYTFYGVILSGLAVFLTILFLSIFFPHIVYGDQYSNPYLIIAFCCFSVYLLIFTIYILHPKSSHDIHDIFLISSSRYKYILYGGLLYASALFYPLLFIPSGFISLASLSHIGLFLVLFGLSLGLSLPCLAMFFYPELSNFIPERSKYIKSLRKFIIVMLLLSILWFVFIYSSQVVGFAGARLIIYSFVLGIIFLYSKLIGREINRRVVDDLKRQEVRAKAGRFILLLLFLVVSVSFFDAYKLYSKKSSSLSDDHHSLLSDINKDISLDKVVLIKIDYPWCLKCKLTNSFTFSNVYIQRLIDNNKLEIISIDWDMDHSTALQYMEHFNYYDLPLYILYSKSFPRGIILPQTLTEAEFNDVLVNVID